MNRSQRRESPMSKVNVTFLVSIRPGDDPDVSWAEHFRRSIDVDVVDHRLGDAAQQIGLSSYAKLLAGEFVIATRNFLEDRLAVAAVESQVLADVFQGLQEAPMRLGDDDPVVMAYTKDYTDEDATVYKFTVTVNSDVG